MTTILDEIIASKHKEVAARKELYPVKLLEQNLFFSAPTVSLSEYLRRPDKVGIIAEIKRRSPSKGIINQHISVEALSVGYMQAGASALSVLTDQKYFGGSLEDLKKARAFNYCPILRKDFIVDEYQIVEARSAGADVILLIAAALSPKGTAELARFARSLGLETLLEVHSAEELSSHLCDDVDIVGVNNRNLHTFEVSTSLAEELVNSIPKSMCAVAESGISDAKTLLRLKKVGYRGFLIGEAFMRHGRPDEACQRFIQEVERNGASRD
jgi:indole-3-glycerol phosphate synthase